MCPRRVALALTQLLSSQIFRVLTPCLEPLPDGTRLHRADLAVDCDSATYLRAFNTAIVLIFVFPVGIPATCAQTAAVTSRALISSRVPQTLPSCSACARKLTRPTSTGSTSCEFAKMILISSTSASSIAATRLPRTSSRSSIATAEL